MMIDSLRGGRVDDTVLVRRSRLRGGTQVTITGTEGRLTVLEGAIAKDAHRYKLLEDVLTGGSGGEYTPRRQS